MVIVLPGFHSEQAAVFSFIVKLQNDFFRTKDGVSLGLTIRKVGIDERDNGLNAKVGIAADNGEEIFLLAVIKGFKDSVVVHEARELLIEVSPQERHVECNA